MKKGTFISIWDGGIEISTPAELDEQTGEVYTEPINVDGLDILNREYFIDEDEKEYEICPECHTYIMKTVMKDGIGHCLDEVRVCSDPECENNY